MQARRIRQQVSGDLPIRPEKVSREARIKALNDEMKAVEENRVELKANLAKVNKGTEEHTVLELRRILKDDYMNGLRNLMSMEIRETGKSRLQSNEKYDFIDAIPPGQRNVTKAKQPVPMIKKGVGSRLR